MRPSDGGLERLLELIEPEQLPEEFGGRAPTDHGPVMPSRERPETEHFREFDALIAANAAKAGSA